MNSIYNIKDETGEYCFKQPVSPDAILQIASTILKDRYAPGEECTSADDASAYLQSRLRHHEREVFACLWLTTRHTIIEFEELSFGTINGATVHSREVVKSGLKHNAGAVIFSHNHPSNNATPSAADIDITNRLVSALELVDIRVLDHIIVGDSDTVSMAKCGLI